MNKPINVEHLLPYMVIFIPVAFISSGVLFFPYPLEPSTEIPILLLLYSSLLLLGIGYLKKDYRLAPLIKSLGWLIFAFYWSTRINTLYYSEGEDVFNALLCSVGIIVLVYISYHEILSFIRNDHLKVLNWLAGSASIAGLTYFTLSLVTPLRDGLILTVAEITTDILRIFGFVAYRQGSTIYCGFQPSPITIIFACTAIQAISLFLGMILALENVEIKRKIIGVSIAVIPIWLANLVRTAGVVYLVSVQKWSFFIVHNVISKIGGVLTLIIILILTFRLLPELYDNVNSALDMYKREGPLESMIKTLMWRK